MTDIALDPPRREPRPVYFLLHLPKTAGQTICAHLADHCPAGAYLEPSRGAQTLQSQAASDAVALSGHWLRRSMEAAFPSREIRRTVLLRDPVGLHLSLYNYRMMNYRAKGLGSYDFALHLASLPRNYLAFCLLTRWLGFSRMQAMCMPEDRQFAVLDAMLKDFWFVGSYRDCDQLLARIAGDLGVPPVAARRNEAVQWQEIVAWKPLRQEAIGAALEDRIRRDNAVDQALWERWAVHVAPAPPPARSPGLRGATAVGTLLQEIRRRSLRDVVGATRIGQRSRVRRADAARSRRDWPRAALAYRDAIGASAGTPSLWIELARAQRARGDEQAARTAFDRALALKPDMPSIRLERDLTAATHRTPAKPAGVEDA